MKNQTLFILLIVLLFNCSCEDSEDLLVVNDYTVSMYENPSQNDQLIGTIPYDKPAYYKVIFTILSQNVPNAIWIGHGDIHVSDPTVFDFETNPVIIANVLVDMGSDNYDYWDSSTTKTITVTINLNDLPD